MKQYSFHPHFHNALSVPVRVSVLVRVRPGLSLFLLLLPLFTSAAPDFQNDIAPILRQYCAGCHNNDEPEAEFSVETYANLMKGGESKVAIIPGNPEKSYFIQTITHTKKPHMPPRKEPQLNQAQIQTLQEWVKAGAQGPARDISILSNLVTPKFPGSKEELKITAKTTSPNGKIQATGSYQTVQFGKFRHRGLPGKVNALAFSPDNQLIAAGSGITGLRGNAIVYSVTTGRPKSFLKGQQKDVITALAFSPDNQTLATASYDSTIQLWSTQSGKPLRKLSGHNGAVHSISWAPNSQTLASASADQSIKIWNTQTGQLLDTRSQPTAEQYTVSITSDGKHFLATGADKQIRLWKLLSLNKPRINPLLQVRFAHESEILHHELSKDGTTLTTQAADGTSKTWTLPHLNPISPQSTLSQKSTPPSLSTPSSKSTPLQLPSKVDSHLDSPAHLYKFSATKGETWVFEVHAARNKSPLDSKLQILHPDGTPVERISLQATKESWLTFRGKNSQTSGDFRLFKQDEMTLNQLLYVNGEVVKLWHYPRGPDSGYIVYPGYGDRETLFDTTPLAHPLGQPAYIVKPLAAEETPQPNGLPTFSIPYENDDDPSRTHGKDSILTFKATQCGEYLLRISDIRGQHGKDYKYTLEARPPKPDFKLTTNQFQDGIPKGAGREFSFKVKRLDNYNGPIQIDIAQPPTGLHVTTPITVQPGQIMAYGAIHADPNAPEPKIKELKITATATIDGKKVTHELTPLKNIKLLDPPKLKVRVEPQQITIRPGQTIAAKVFIERNGHKTAVNLGKHDAGRNLPHGVYVDNIGLNGLLIPQGQSEREFFITCDKWVPETSRLFHLKTGQEKGIASPPIRLHVRKK